MPYINVDEAYILDNTGLQVDQAVDIPFADAGFTDTQKAQARANIAAGGSNVNLLDNPWFTVNQRSLSTYSTNAYSVDRWKVNASTTLTVGTTGVTLSAGGGFRQYLPLSQILDGKTYTFSAMTDDGSVYSMTGTLNSSASGWQVNAHLLQNYIWCGIRVNSGKWDIDITSTNGVTITATKLELGSYSTLANDTPPDYATELAKCQRYFFRLKMESNRCYAVGFAESTTSVRIALPVPSPMRSDPTVTTSGTIRFKGNGGLLTPSAFATSNSYPPDATARINCTVSGATQYQLYALSANDSSTYIDLSADL